MFEQFRLRDVLVQYKQNFVSKQWGEEKYKWEAVKWFQDNWDVNAPDFAEMLNRSLDKTYNLLASANNFPKGMIVGFAKSAPEEVRAMFLSLYDESKDVYERMNAFKMQSTVLLEKYGNGAAQHYQYENAISTYLWLRFPDKYYIYKFGEVKTVASELEADYRFKKGAYADNIRNFLKLYDEISTALKEDTELVNLFQSQLTDTCYPDPKLKTLTIDVGFYIMHNLFAAILAKGIGRQLKQGLYREYLNCKEDVAVVRGKIDMPGTIQNHIARKRVLTCEYDELSENNLLNQILKTTVMLLLRHTKVDQEYKSELKKEMLFFSNVDTIDPSVIRWSAIRFQRNNNTYRMLISLCQLILEGMLLTTDSGEYKLASFVDEQRMNRLYEKFILEYYAKECPQVTATASQIPWALDDGIGTMLPVMQSDIMLTKGSDVLIIDAKYYTHTTQTQYDVHTVHSSNLYQIFTYVKNKDAEFGDKPHTVSGVLLYAATDETIQPDHSYQMSGNKISVRTLDLNRNFSEIAAQLNVIVDEHFSVS